MDLKFNTSNSNPILLAKELKERSGLVVTAAALLHR